MNRTQLQDLADARVLDADALLNASRWSAAYYLAGYAIECALKACIARLNNLHDFPDKDLVMRSYTHHIDTLVQVAGLKPVRDADANANAALDANWLTVKDWSEKSRYQQWSEPEARKLFAAVSDAANGVLPWIKNHW